MKKDSFKLIIMSVAVICIVIAGIMVPGIVLEANQKSEHDHVAKVPKSYLPSGKEYAKEYGEEQKEEGILQGKNNMLYSLVSKGRLKIDVAAEEANVSLGEFEKSMEEAGYKIPELV